MLLVERNLFDQAWLVNWITEAATFHYISLPENASVLVDCCLLHIILQFGYTAVKPAVEECSCVQIVKWILASAAHDKA